MKKIFRALLAVTLVAFGGTALLWAWFALTPPKLANVKWQDGDIVFQTLPGLQDIAVAFATASPYTHMGFVRVRGKNIVVVEAVGPVKETPLSEWSARGTGKRLAAMRIKNITGGATGKAIARARREYGKPYDIYFLPSHDAFYCSELVRVAFLAAGVTLGQMEKVSELSGSYAMDEIIRRRWQSYPPCKKAKGMTLEKCRGIIMQQELVTPASIARDSQLEPLYSNYPLD